MAQIFNFPTPVMENSPSKEEGDHCHESYHKDDLSVFSSIEEDKVFLSLIHEWPCFGSIDKSLDLQRLLELYYDDELTSSQDCTLEFLFHMNDPKSAFDIGTALYTWEDEDHNFFILSLNLHAEIINQIKKEEI
mgnify:CR=1 FL=1